MLVAINDRIESSRSVIDVRSSVHYFTTGWNNNWVINSDVLYDDEKAQYENNRCYCDYCSRTYVPL